MFRSLVTLALSVLLVAEACAQTAPAATKKAARTTRRVAQKAQRTVRKTIRQAAAWPATGPAAPVMAAATEPTGWEAYDDAQARQGRDAVYAAPGLGVHIRTGHEMDNYDGTPRKAPVGTKQTTLSPSPR